MATASRFQAFLNSPVGPKTTHFWGPIANWGFVAAVCFLFPIFLFSYDPMAFLHSLIVFEFYFPQQ